MSHYYPGSLGEFTGKTGEIVTYRRGKLKIGRATPVKTKKRTKAPVKNQRSRMGLMSHFLQKMNAAVKIGFPNKGIYSPMNKAVKYNIKTALSGTFPDLKIDYPKIQLSSGWLDQVYTPRMSITKASKIQITWLNPSNLKPGVEETDTVQLYFFSETQAGKRRTVKGFNNAAFRVDGQATIDLEKCLQGIIHSWMFLISADGKRVSNSKYLGMVILGQPEKDGA